MRIARVIGTVTLNRQLPSLDGARLKIAAPLALEALTSQSQADQESVVVWDELGAGQGSLIAMSEGPEASRPFRPEKKPVDAYCAALIDDLEIKMPVHPLNSTKK